MGLCAPLPLATQMANTLRRAQMTRYLVGYENDCTIHRKRRDHIFRYSPQIAGALLLGARTISLRVWDIQALSTPVIGRSLRVHIHDARFVAISTVRKYTIPGMMDNTICA